MSTRNLQLPNGQVRGKLSCLFVVSALMLYANVRIGRPLLSLATIPATVHLASTARLVFATRWMEPVHSRPSADSLARMVSPPSQQRQFVEMNPVTD